MKTIAFILSLLVGFSAFSQDMDLYRPLIQKRKLIYCVATTTTTAPDAQPVSHKSGQWHFDAKGRISKYERYDDKGALYSSGFNVFNEKGQLTEAEKDNQRINEHERHVYVYDEKGRQIEEKEFRDQVLVVTYKHYFGDDMLMDSTVWLTADGKGELWEYYRYNEKGWLVEQWEVNELGKNDGKTLYEYHADGTLKAETLYDGFGDVFETVAYNDMGFPTQKVITYIDYTVSYEMAYDKKGVLLSMAKKQSNKSQIETTVFVWAKKLPKK